MNMKNVFKISFAIIAGIAVYCVGWFAGGIVGHIQSKFILILPPTVSRDLTWATSAALAANLGSYGVFDKLFPNVSFKRQAMVTWSFVLAIIAIVYVVLCLVSGDTHLLVYPYCCSLPVGFLIYSSFKEMNAPKEAAPR